MKTLLILMFLAGSFLIVQGCGNNKEDEKQKQPVVHTEESSPATTVPVTLSVDEFEGMKLFMRKCNKCHPGGEKGKGPSLNDKEFPRFLIHWQVRVGLGAMPKFTDEEINKDQLQQIVSFVKLMQKMTKE